MFSLSAAVEVQPLVQLAADKATCMPVLFEPADLLLVPSVCLLVMPVQVVQVWGARAAAALALCWAKREIDPPKKEDLVPVRGVPDLRQEAQAASAKMAQISPK